MRTDNIYIEIGKTLELIQSADRIFQTVLQVCLPGAATTDLALWNQNEKLLDRATLGKMIHTLKCRTEMTESFEENLDNYLGLRNEFIHDWDTIEGWSDDDQALEHIETVQKHAAWTFYVMASIVHSWSKQTDFKYVTHDPIENEKLIEFWAELDTNWQKVLGNCITKLKHENAQP